MCPITYFIYCYLVAVCIVPIPNFTKNVPNIPKFLDVCACVCMCGKVCVCVCDVIHISPSSTFRWLYVWYFPGIFCSLFLSYFLSLQVLRYPLMLAQNTHRPILLHRDHPINSPVLCFYWLSGPISCSLIKYFWRLGLVGYLFLLLSDEDSSQPSPSRPSFPISKLRFSHVLFFSIRYFI